MYKINEKDINIIPKTHRERDLLFKKQLSSWNFEELLINIFIILV